MKSRDKLILVLVIGILLRLLVMPHTRHPATGVKVDLMDELFLEGFLPILRTSGFGTSFYLFYAPLYSLYGLLQSWGLGHNFVLYTLFKIPPLVGNLIIFYSLYEILRIETGSEDTALKVSAFYFLNPYVIFIEAWVGHAEQLSVSLILLSFLFLLKGQSGKSGVFYALSIFTRYIPILLLPAFIYYTRFNKKKNLSLNKFMITFIFIGLLLFFPYLFVIFDIYRYSPQIFTRYFSHFFEAVTIKSTYAAPNVADFVLNFTGFFYAVGLWDKIKVVYGAKAFLTAYLSAAVAILLLAKRRWEEVSTRWFVIFPILLYVLFMVLIPLQQHHYLSWLLPFLFLAVGLSMVPGYYITIFWIGNLLIDPVIGGGYKHAFGNTFLDPFKEKTAYFVNLQIQQTMGILMGLILIFSIYFCFKSMINSNLTIRNKVWRGEITLEAMFFPVLLIIFSIAEMIRMVYHPTLYTIKYSVLFGLFVLVEFFRSGGKDSLTFLELEGRSLTQILNISSMLLILGAVSLYYLDLSYVPIFAILTIVGLGNRDGGIGQGDIDTNLPALEILTFAATTYILLLLPNHLTLSLYAVFLATWIARQIGLGRDLLEGKRIYLLQDMGKGL